MSEWYRREYFHQIAAMRGTISRPPRGFEFSVNQEQATRWLPNTNSRLYHLQSFLEEERTIKEKEEGSK